jgi:hypothetical protein
MEQFATGGMPNKVTAIRREDLQQACITFFGDMLRIPTAPLEVSSAAASQIVTFAIEAKVTIAGPWTACVYLRATDATAQLITERMFETSGKRLTEADIVDAIGESVNIIGGSVKGIINQDCQLSLPEVTRELAEAPAIDWLTLIVGGSYIQVVVIDNN